MVELYHFGMAICAQKVRLALDEKGVAWESRIVEGSAGGLRSAEYLRLNPNGVVPTLVCGDNILTESRIISEYIEEAFAGPALMPGDLARRHTARLWAKQIDDSLHLHVYILSFIVSMRDRYLAMPQEQWATGLPGLRDVVKRACTIDLLKEGFRSRYVGFAIDRFRRLVNEMDAQVTRSPWLAGPDYSLADADYTAYVGRLEELGLDWLWEDRPALADWWARVRARPSYRTAILDWVGDGEAVLKAQAAGRAAPHLREALAAAT